MNRVNRDRSVDFLVVFFAAALTIHVTPSIGTTEIRIAVSDPVLPFFSIALWLAASPDSRRELVSSVARNKAAFGGLALMTCVLATALVIGWARSGELIRWAVFNKFAGWLILLGYFAVGWALISLRREAAGILFIRALIAAAILQSVLVVAIRALARLGMEWAVRFDSIRAEGLIENPNAFGFFLAISIVLYLALERRARWRSYLLDAFALGVMGTALMLSASRGSWLAISLGLTTLIWLLPARIWRVLPAAALATACLWGLASFGTNKSVEPGTDPPPAGQYWLSRDGFRGGESTLAVRIRMAEEAGALWLKTPVFGAGLGIYYWESAQKPDASPAHLTLHSTPLWLLAETGLFGVLVFGSFFIFCLRQLYPGRNFSSAEPDYRVRAAAFLTLIVFAGMSVSMEATYQRHLWVLLGLGLGVAARRHVKSSHAS